MFFLRSGPPRRSSLLLGFTFVTLTLATTEGQTDHERGPFVFRADASGPTWNGLSGGTSIDASEGLSALQAMLWKYVARCALPEGQELEAPEVGTGKRLKFPGFFGLAPAWRDGTCDQGCKEKVSACLIALTNRTGKHVLLGIVSGDPAMGKALLPDEGDRPFPHQEGVFFGDVFANQAFACQGRDVAKGKQVKRFCALQPATCSGLVSFVDTGRCDDVCKSICTKLSDGSERCAAVSCTDPQGKVWTHPLTTYLRNKIEAVNADAMKGVAAAADAVDGLDAGDSLTFKHVDFGSLARPVTTFAASFQTSKRGSIDLWIDGKRRVGALEVKPDAANPTEQTTILKGGGSITGTHAVTLKVTSGRNIGRLATIEFR